MLRSMEKYCAVDGDWAATVAASHARLLARGLRAISGRARRILGS